MTMLVALGVMSITWMAVIAVLVLAPRLLPAKTYACRESHPRL